jgi:hypothetical protein
MRRLLRILLNAVTLLSLLLFLATLVLWVRNNWRSDYIVFQSGNCARSLILKDGVIQWKSVQYRYGQRRRRLEAHSFSKQGTAFSSQDPFFINELVFTFSADPIGRLERTRRGFAAGVDERTFPGLLPDGEKKKRPIFATITRPFPCGRPLRCS